MRRRLSGLAAVLILAAAPARAQAPDFRGAFLNALGAFSLALDGTYGDEGPALTAALDRVAQAVAAWDTAIATYERAMAAELPRADARTAARMHLALGVAYVERLRVADALEQFEAAARLDPTLRQAVRLRGLVLGQLREDPAAAADSLRAALSIDSSDPADAYLLAYFAGQSGTDASTDDAHRAFLDAIDRAGIPDDRPSAPFIRLGLVPETPGVDPFLPPALYADGFKLLRGGDLAGAVAQLRQALARDPLAHLAPQPDAPRTLAAAAFRAGNIERAQAQLEAALARTPGDAEAHRLLGMVLMAAGATDRGRQELRKAIDLNPVDERARVGLAGTFIDDGDDVQAVEVLRATVTTLPNSARARYLLGLVLQRQKQYAEAITAFESTIPRGPLLGLNTVYRAIGALHRDLQDFDGAVAAYAARVALTPNDAAAHRDLGDIYSLRGETVRAETEFRVAVLLDPANVGAHTALAQTYLREGRYQDAADAAAQALRVDETNREARYVLGTAFVRLGRLEEGSRELETFNRLQQEDAAERARRLEISRLRREAQVSAAAGDHGTAVDRLRQALDLDPAAAELQLALGEALLAAGRPQDALEPLGRAAAEAGAPPEVHLRLADAYTALGRPAEAQRARQAYTRARSGAGGAGASR